MRLGWGEIVTENVHKNNLTKICPRNRYKIFLLEFEF